MVNLATASDRAALDELERLPGSLELPDSDDTPVDNEGQNDIPNGLRLALAQLWHNRQDWFFGVDMGIYDRIGRVQGILSGIPMEWLTWFDHLGQAYPLPEEVIETLRVKVQRQQGRIAKLEQLAQEERSRAEIAEFLAQQERLARLQLIDRLKQMGIDSSLLDN